MSDVSVSPATGATKGTVAADPPDAGFARFDVIITPASSLDPGGVRWFFAGVMALTGGAGDLPGGIPRCADRCRLAASG
jgi:hypothetical protein